MSFVLSSRTSNCSPHAIASAVCEAIKSRVGDCFAKTARNVNDAARDHLGNNAVSISIVSGVVEPGNQRSCGVDL